MTSHLCRSKTYIVCLLGVVLEEATDTRSCDIPATAFMSCVGYVCT